MQNWEENQKIFFIETVVIKIKMEELACVFE